MSFEKCRNLFRDGLLAGLGEITPFVQSIVTSADGDIPINALSLSVTPWFGQAEIAVRLESDPLTRDVAEWSQYDDLSDLCNSECKAMADAAKFARGCLGLA